jgi:N-acetylneuraminic acid mutarotase
MCYYIAIVLASTGNAYFDLPKLTDSLPFTGGMATALFNNRLYMFGGEASVNRFNENFYQLTKTEDTFEWKILQQNNPPPGTTYAQAVVTNSGLEMYLLGGVSISTDNQVLPLQYYKYTFDTNTWTAAATNAVSFTPNFAGRLPLNRKLFSATCDNKNKIYIYGGTVNSTAVFTDFFFLDTITGTFTPLARPPSGVGRYSHTATLLRYFFINLMWLLISYVRLLVY